MIVSNRLKASQATFAGGASFTLDYLGTATTAKATTITFSSVSFGDPDSDRIIIVGFGFSSGSTTVNSVSIGGVSATQLVQRSQGGVTVNIYAAAVPTGTTGNIVINISKSQDIRIGWFRMVGASAGITPTNSGSTSVGSGTISLACTVPTDGVGVVVVADENPNIHTGANYTELWDATDNGGTDGHTGGTFSTSATLTCQNDVSNASDKALVYASWGP